MSDVPESAREAIVAAGRRLVARGLVTGSAGNLSVRSEDLVIVSPAGVALDRLRADSLAVLSLDGEQLSGPLDAAPEVALHLAIYAGTGTTAIVHTHAPMATALSCSLDELPLIHPDMLALGGAVRVAPFAPFGSRKHAAHVLAALDGRSALLLANHGAITHGTGLAAAVKAAELLEWSSELYWRAASVGRPRVLTLEQAESVATAAQSGPGGAQESIRGIGPGAGRPQASGAPRTDSYSASRPHAGAGLRR